MLPAGWLWVPAFAGTTDVINSATVSHRLEAAVELDLDQHRAIAGESLGEEIGRVVNRLGPLSRDAERARQRDEIDRRVEELHAHIGIHLRGKAALRRYTLFPNATPSPF